MSIKDSSNNSHQCWIIFEFPTKKLVISESLPSRVFMYLRSFAFTAA